MKLDNMKKAFLSVLIGSIASIGVVLLVSANSESQHRFFLISYYFSTSKDGHSGYGDCSIECNGFPQRASILKFMCQERDIDPKNIVILNVYEFKYKADYDSYSSKYY